MASTSPAESFRDLLLRHRGRTGLTQRQLADHLGVHRRSVQEWENGASYPSPERLKGLLRVLLEAGGLTAGHEVAEAEVIWSAVQREAPRTHAPFDRAWFAGLLGERAAPLPATEPARAGRPATAVGRGQDGPVERRQDWGEAPDTAAFVGRTDELALLRRWVQDERRLLAVLGMGGIGKTSLAAKLAHDVAPSYERLYWRSLRDAPPPSDWLAGAIGFLSDQQAVPPAAESDRISALLGLLRERRCLLVLDNFETLFEPGQHHDAYRPGVAGYGRLLEVIAMAAHRSCLVLTSREAPAELALLGDSVRTFQLGGLGVDEARVLLASKHLAGSGAEWAELVAHFGGNGLALKVASESIRELFEGDIGAFLAEARISSIFGAMRRLLAEQVERSSVPEQQVLRVLAIEREPVRLPALLAALGPRVGRAAALEAIEVLRRRSLVERSEAPGAPAFTLQSVVLEYVTERLVEAVANEIERATPALVLELSVIRAQAKDYVRQAQERLIGAPIVQRLKVHHGERGTQQRLLALLDGWRARPAEEQGYGPGNVVNLLRLLRGELRGLDLSNLTIRQAYLAEVEAQDANLSDAQLAEGVLPDAFNLPVSLALSADGALLAAGTAGGEVWLWRVADRRLLLAIQGQTGAVEGLALAADGRVVAGGDAAGSVRLWDTSTGQLLATLQGHSSGVLSIVLAADGHLVVSGDAVGTMHVWDTSTGRALATWRGHRGGVWSLASSADGQRVASGSGDGTVRLWDVTTGAALAILDCRSPVRSVALSSAGDVVASGSEDGALRLWDGSTGALLATLPAHAGGTWSVALSSDGRLVASGGGDAATRLWDVTTGAPLTILEAHVSGVRGLALSSAGDLVASSSEDGAIRLWEAPTGRVLATLRGQAGGIWSVALSSDGRLVASGGGDRLVRLWDTSAGQPLASLSGHTLGVRHVAMAADGGLLASGSWDGTVRFWEAPAAEGDAAERWAGPGARLGAGPTAAASTGRPLALPGDRSGEGVALSADGRLLASYGDRRVWLWELPSCRLLAAMPAHAAAVWDAVLSPDGHLLATGAADGMVRLWDTSTRQLLASMQAHPSGVSGVALSADTRLLAGTNADGTVRLWDTRTGRVLATLEGHTSAVISVALSASALRLASGSEDGTVRLWAAPCTAGDAPARWTSSPAEPGASAAQRPPTLQPVATLLGHSGAVWGVALSADGHLVVSGGLDGTVRLWEASTGACLRTLRPERRYERLDITGLRGITDAQRAALVALGAREQAAPAMPGTGC